LRKKEESPERKRKGFERRYWEEEDSSVKCFNCNEYGHMAFQCITEKKYRPCYLCSSTIHQVRDCPQKLCFKCNLMGHKIKDCPYKRSSNCLGRCNRCGIIGHLTNECREKVSTTDESEMATESLSCYNCGGSGHSGRFCTKPTILEWNEDEPRKKEKKEK